jgi:ribosomal protein L6P/L9E
MLWYESFPKNKIKSKTSVDWHSSRQKNMRKFFINYIVPAGWHLIISQNAFKNSYNLFFYSKTYFFTLTVLEKCKNLQFDIGTNQVFFKNPFPNNFVATYGTVINSLYNTLIRPNFIKVTFKGKGYYIYKNYRNTITPQFGYSHRLYLYASHTRVKFLSKTSLLIFGINAEDIKKVSSTIRSWRFINIFTNRGVRFSKQVVYKKSGKVSTYR